MIKLSKDSPIDFNQYLMDLSELGYVYMNKRVLDTVIRELPNTLSSARYLVEDVMATKSAYFISTLNRKNVVTYLKQFENCPDFYFKVKNIDGDSLDSKKVLKPLLEKGYANEFINKYMDYTSMSSMSGFMNKSIKSMAVDTDLKTSNGDELCKIKFHYEQQPNLRVYTKDSNIQGIPKKYCNMMEAPDGYVLVSGDFAQSDMRIAYSMMLRDDENIKIMSKYDDIYEGYFRIILGDDFNLEEFKTHRQEYKAFALAPIYGASYSVTELGRRIVNIANKYLDNFPVYKEYKRRLQRRIDLGLPVVTKSYFGYQDTVISNSYDKSKSLMNFALNSPIQTGTSEIVISVERYIMEEFKKLGITSDNQGIFAYLNRHDELIFLVKEEYLKYSYIFQNAETVQVDDWFPLKIQFSYHRKYTVEDEQLNNFAKRYYKSSSELEVPTPGKGPKSFYIPTDDIIEIAVGTYNVPNTTDVILSYYDYINERCMFEIVKDADADKIFQSVQSKIALSRDKLLSNGVNVVIVCSQLQLQDSLANVHGLLIKNTRSYKPSIFSISQQLAEYMGMKYCNKNNIEYDSICLNKSFIPKLVQIIDNGIIEGLQ